VSIPLLVPAIEKVTGLVRLVHHWLSCSNACIFMFQALCSQRSRRHALPR